MSEENGKVCCNCRHNLRKRDIHDRIICVCEVSGDWLSHIRVMTGWCRHWAKESEETETWNGIHAQITAPKGTFDRIFNDADDDDDINDI